MSCIINGSTSTYKYGADGLRRQKTVNGTTTDSAYDATMLVREGHAAGGSLTPATVTATYFQGASGPCYRRDDTQTQTDGQGHTFGKTGWYVFDGLGSVVGEVDPLGNVTSSPKYDVYGAVRSNGGSATSKQGFVGSLGHVSDTETGLIYMRARYMDPQTGRFSSEDPAKSGVNWFVYCDCNPVNATDATGKVPATLWLDILGLFIAGLCVWKGNALIDGGIYLGLGTCLATLGWAIVIGIGVFTVYEVGEYLMNDLNALIKRQQNSAGIAMTATSNTLNIVAVRETVLEILVASLDDD